MNWDHAEFETVRSAMRAAGVSKLYAKVLAPNDNSKNQIYLGGSLDAAQLLPFSKPVPEVTSKGRRTLKAKLKLFWLGYSGSLHFAPDAQLILYPQYPEVRLGSILKGASGAPSKLISSRDRGRVLLIGVSHDRRVVLVCVPSASPIAQYVMRISKDSSLLQEIPLSPDFYPDGQRKRILELLRTVHEGGWLTSESLHSDGSRHPCKSGNCVGYTLEAALGIAKNGRPGPDLLGWELKGAEVRRPLFPPPSKAFTLMTPEPNGGMYDSEGPSEFVRRYGYPDVSGRPNRLNFGGVHRIGEMNTRTKLTMLMDGVSANGGFDPFGKLRLVDDQGDEAASWSFAKLAELWNHKHAQAAFMFAKKRETPVRSYCFGPRVDLAVGTQFGLFLQALACGAVYYDPGLKLENANSQQPKLKRRSQFRIKFKNLELIYDAYKSEMLS